MQRVWLIRAGEDAEVIDPMRRAGLIGIRYDEIGDAATMTPAEIEQAFLDANRSFAGQHRARMHSFASEVKPGDLIVTPNANRREVWLSIVTGDYRFDPEPSIAGYNHTRTVDWLGWLDRDAHWMSDQSKAIEHPVVLVELYNREWWWRQYDTKDRSVAPRPASSKPPPKPAASRTRTASAAKPKPAPTARPKPVTMVLCAGQCGLQWSPHILVGGLCPDCRGD